MRPSFSETNENILRVRELIRGDRGFIVLYISNKVQKQKAVELLKKSPYSHCSAAKSGWNELENTWSFLQPKLISLPFSKVWTSQDLKDLQDSQDLRTRETNDQMEIFLHNWLDTRPTSTRLPVEKLPQHCRKCIISEVVALDLELLFLDIKWFPVKKILCIQKAVYLSFINYIKKIYIFSNINIAQHI